MNNLPYIIVRVFKVSQEDCSLFEELEEKVCTEIAKGYTPLGSPFRFDDGWAQTMIEEGKDE